MAEIELSDLEKMLEHKASYARWKNLSMFLFVFDCWFLVALGFSFRYDLAPRSTMWFIAILAMLASQLCCSLQADRQKRLFEELSSKLLKKKVAEGGGRWTG